MDVVKLNRPDPAATSVTVTFTRDEFLYVLAATGRVISGTVPEDLLDVFWPSLNQAAIEAGWVAEFGHEAGKLKSASTLSREMGLRFANG